MVSGWRPGSAGMSCRISLTVRAVSPAQSDTMSNVKKGGDRLRTAVIYRGPGRCPSPVPSASSRRAQARSLSMSSSAWSGILQS
jgi:hypothetical protein